MQRLPCFSAVVEWENARLAGAARATRMLRELVNQTRELSSRINGRSELIILFERGAVSPEVVEKAVAEASATDGPFDVRLHETNGSSYYGQKNEGAALASRDYLLFVDSDVVPEPGWLRALLGSLRPGVQVVGGSTYIDPETFAGRAFGLFWFFPSRSPAVGIKPTTFFYANNVIFRRDLFLAHGFPDLPLYRGHCSVLATTLRRRGVRLFLQTAARVSHAPPEPGDFVHRALCEGYDQIVRANLSGKTSALGPRELLRQLSNMRKRVSERRRQLKLGPTEGAAATMVGGAYFLLRFAGQRLAARSPQRAQRLLRI